MKRIIVEQSDIFMSPIIQQFEFKTLRQAYIEVKAFIEEESASRVSSLNTKIEEDLGCAGDDNAELLTPRK